VAIRASRHQSYAMAVRCEHARQFGAYARRGTGNQRHTFSHDSMLLNQLHVMRPTLDDSIRLRPDASHLQAYRRIQMHSTTELNRDIMRFIAPRDRLLPRALKFRHVRYRAIDGSGRPTAARQLVTSAISGPSETAVDSRPAIRRLSSIRSREDTPSRSAARQTTLSSNSLTSPST